MNELPWFRLHTDFLTNGRIKLLSFEDRCHFVELLCLKASGGLEQFKSDAELQLRRVAKALELSDTDADECRSRLIAVGLIDDKFEPCGWDKRQYQSDNSTARTRRWRDKKKQEETKSNECVTEVGRHRDVTVTAPETDTESESEKERGASRFAPKGFKPTKENHEWAVGKGLLASEISQETEKFLNYEWVKPLRDWQRAWRNWILKSLEFRKQRVGESAVVTTEDMAAKHGVVRRKAETEEQFKRRVRDAMIAAEYGLPITKGAAM